MIKSVSRPFLNLAKFKIILLMFLWRIEEKVSVFLLSAFSLNVSFFFSSELLDILDSILEVPLTRIEEATFSLNIWLFKQFESNFGLWKLDYQWNQMNYFHFCLSLLFFPNPKIMKFSMLFPILLEFAR